MMGGASSRRGLWLDPRTKILLLLLCILSAMMAPSLFYELGLVVLIGLLGVCFGDGRRRPLDDHMALMSVLRMSCGLEPYLRRFTADIQPRKILEFLLLDEEFPRSIRFATARIEEHLSATARYVDAAGHAGPERLAGRLRARLQYADMDELDVAGAGVLITTVLDDCAALHQAIYDTFVAYSLEMRLPA